MNESIYERIHKTLTWKRIIGFNVVLFLILIVPLSVRLAQEDTENRSGAAGEIEVPAVTPPPSYPTAPPTIERVNMFFGKTGDTVVVIGSNFGAYKWGSQVYVGSREASDEEIVRWSNNVLEVKIPESARTGQVWVNVNGQEARWDGSLLIYDAARSAQVGLSKVQAGEIRMNATNAQSSRRGMVELGYVSEPIVVTAGPNIKITEQTNSVDSLGKKVKIIFEVSSPLASTQTALFSVTYPGIGAVELVRAELYDQNNSLIPLYSDPLSVKILP